MWALRSDCLSRSAPASLCKLGQDLCLDCGLTDKTLPGVIVKIKRDHVYKVRGT